MASWDDLKRTPRPTPEPDEFASLCAQAFTTPAGRALLSALHSRFIDAVPHGAPDDRALVMNHAKRQLVRELEEQTARGLAALKQETNT